MQPIPIIVLLSAMASSAWAVTTPLISGPYALLSQATCPAGYIQLPVEPGGQPSQVTSGGEVDTGAYSVSFNPTTHMVVGNGFVQTASLLYSGTNQLTDSTIAITTTYQATATTFTLGTKIYHIIYGFQKVGIAQSFIATYNLQDGCVRSLTGLHQ